jgi:GNAT superfamily N-acetyltransferase
MADRPVLVPVEAPPHQPLDLSAVSFELAGPREHGGDDYEPETDYNYLLHALYGGQRIGELDVDAEPGKDSLHVRWVSVEPEFQRNGLGTLLIQEGQLRWPGREFETNGFTSEGEEFWETEPWKQELEREPEHEAEPDLQR